MKLRKVFTFYFLLFVFSSIFARCKKSVPFMKKFWGFLLVIVLMTSCGEYQSLLKSNDYNLVYKKAIEYYNKGDYQRAMNLLDGVRSVFVGQAKAQNIAYYRAFCSYNMKDYQIASDLFKQFIQTYPESSFAEECLYMMGFCDYKASPKPRLDQQVTEKAIREFQLYLSRYPYSMRKDKVNTYMDEMRDKLSYKAYLSAKNYYLREHYKAAVISLQNCLKDYPGSKYREEIMYMLFVSKYQMAVNSVEDKKVERYNNAREEYYYFADEYPNSRYAADVKKMYEDIEAYLENYKFED